MGRKILIIDGHPDSARNHFVHALSDEYEAAASQAGHVVRRINVADLDFPLLRSDMDWQESSLPPDIKQSQQAVRDAQHLVILYPLWLGDVPALLKGFLEQLLRPDFAFRYREQGFPEKLLRGRSARVIVTMGTPAPIYRYFYRAHSLRSLERNVLAFSGIGPTRHLIIGSVADAAQRDRAIARARALGTSGC